MTAESPNVRPAGGILHEHYADRYGWKELLVFVIGLMSAASAMIAATHVRYLNLALPEPGPQGRVLTSTVMLECERVSA